MIWLFLGRILSGLSVGLVTNTATAALTELQPQGDKRQAALISTSVTIDGLGLGALLAGILAQYAPLPTVLVYIVDLGLLLPAVLGI